ncbi:hypothetical protein ACH33_00755 [Aneurinibacillus sp. XH2]|nr:hypothetical protein ACH33_00755 [Aneurinibacillus sp. XH2]
MTFELLSREIAAFNITGPQFLVLRCLKDEPQRISDISRQLCLSNSTVSGIVDRLEENGYVRRVRDEKDRRVVWVFFSEKVKALCREVPALRDDYFDGIFAGVSEDEIKNIVNALQLLADRLKEKIKEKK